MANLADLSDKVWTPEEIAKLKNAFTDGLTTLNEINDLQEHLKEVAKELAAELNLPVSIFKQALRAVNKGNHQQNKDKLAAVEELCNVVGRPIGVDNDT